MCPVGWKVLLNARRTLLTSYDNKNRKQTIAIRSIINFCNNYVLVWPLDDYAFKALSRSSAFKLCGCSTLSENPDRESILLWTPNLPGKSVHSHRGPLEAESPSLGFLSSSEHKSAFWNLTRRSHWLSSVFLLDLCGDRGRVRHRHLPGGDCQHFCRL